jgi:hypothetical protein
VQRGAENAETETLYETALLMSAPPYVYAITRARQRAAFYYDARARTLYDARLRYFMPRLRRYYAMRATAPFMFFCFYAKRTILLMPY